jgi:outer membrane biosynthesis protein TonB
VFSRLATVRRLAPPALALALGAAAAFWLVSCGGQDAQLLPGNTAREITENLDRVRQYASEGECVGAADAAQEVSVQVESLEGVDATLKRALERGTTRLDEAIATCEETTTEPVRPSEETTTGDRTTESSEKEEKKREKELEKLEKEEEKAEKEEEKDEEHEVEPPEEAPEEPPATVPPSEGGGTGAPGGVSPGSAVGGE